MAQQIENAEREQFHAVAKRLGWSTERFDDGTYMSVGADDGWQLWQEARAGLAVEQERWISVEERLPKMVRKLPSGATGSLWMLTYGRDGYYVASLVGSAWQNWRNETIVGVTHYQDLPAPPVHKGDS